jgi:hypothetical protein
MFKRIYPTPNKKYSNISTPLNVIKYLNISTHLPNLVKGLNALASLPNVVKGLNAMISMPNVVDV